MNEQVALIVVNMPNRERLSRFPLIAIAPGVVGRERAISRLITTGRSTMMKTANQNDMPDARPPVPEPDAHGQAALMLTESLLHALMEAGTFTVEQALCVVSTAQEIKVEFAHLTDESPDRLQASLDLLTKIASSIRQEL